MILWAVLFISGIFYGWLFTYCSILVARRYRVCDHPTPRSSHKIPTPRIGGIGIAAPLFLFYIFSYWNRKASVHPSNLVLIDSILIGGGGCFLFGLLDDLRGMKPGKKFFFQFVFALFPVVFGYRIHSLARFAGLVLPPFPGQVAALCWILLMINAFNFMDGMNGMAAGFAATAALFMSLLLKTGSLNLALLAGVCIGFLIYNLTPAETFMGDCGSQLLGFVLAVIPLSLHSSNPVKYPFGSFVILLLPFLYDLLYTLVRRITRGENIFQAHRTHLYQRLLVCGWSHPKVLRLAFITFLLCGLLSVGFAGTSQTGLRILYALAALGIMVIYTGIVWRVEGKSSVHYDGI